MSDEDDPFSDGGDSGTGDEDIERMRKELEQRERGLDDYAEELDDREEELNERERQLREKDKQLEEREGELDEREARIQSREQELDDREVAIEEREKELSDRADELNEKERTLENYVGDKVYDTVEDAVSKGMEGHGGSSRLGTIGSLVLGLVGVMLLVAGTVYGFADQSQSEVIPILFENDAANLGVTILLVFSGLAANLAAVAD